MIQAEQLYRSQQKEGLLAWIQIEIATILLNQNKVVEAVSKLQQADAILRGGESSDSVTLGHWQLVMGMAEAAQSNPTKALYYLAQAEPIFVKEKNQRFLARVYEVRARILEQQGQINGALASLKSTSRPSTLWSGYSGSSVRCRCASSSIWPARSWRTRPSRPSSCCRRPSSSNCRSGAIGNMQWSFCCCW